MKKISVFTLIFVFILLLASAVHAIDLNLINNVTSAENETNTLNTVENQTLDLPSNTVENTVTNNLENGLPANNNTITNTAVQTPTQTGNITGISNFPESSLGLANIINILLIVVGVLLILLGIAILVRAQK